MAVCWLVVKQQFQRRIVVQQDGIELFEFFFLKIATGKISLEDLSIHHLVIIFSLFLKRERLSDREAVFIFIIIRVGEPSAVHQSVKL